MKMKKWISMLLLCTLLGALTACGSDAAKEPEKETSQTDASGQEAEDTKEPAAEAAESESGEESPSDGEGQKELVVYFSWSGNTENVANSIAAQTGADIFKIVPAEPYVDDYDELLDIATKEKQDGARPEIADTIENFEQYDVVYVGYPNWWSDMPMILYTFFDSYDFSGKTIAPFCTSGGSGLSGTINSIKELEPEAEVLDGLHIGDSASSDPDSAVEEWLENLRI